MEEIDLTELRALLTKAPVMAEIHPLSLAFLFASLTDAFGLREEDVCIYEDAWQMAADLDALTPQPPKPMLSVGIEGSLLHRLPAVRCIHDALSSELNRVLLRRFDFIKKCLLCQSQIPDEITKRADADTLAIMLVDGLSYSDIKEYASEYLQRTTPVLVDGISITEHGMARLVGKPSIQNLLFDAGFCKCLGFTYWERENEPLTARLFAGFGNRVRKVKSFDEVLSSLEKEELQGVYVQIVRTGLDGMAHRHRDKPNVSAVVSDIMNDYKRLASVFESKGKSAWVHLVSEHGVLWAHEHALQPYEFAPAEQSRYYEYAKSGEHTLCVTFEGKEFTMLEYPYLRRELRTTEWGVHGGLSYEESVVPWISIFGEW